MRFRMLSAWLGSLLLMGSIGSAQADPSLVDDFLLTFDDFRLSQSSDTLGAVTFFSGTTDLTDPGFPDAGVIAVEFPGRRERWRAVREVPGGFELSGSVAADAGRVCFVSSAGGTIPGSRFAVSCYHAASGRQLWERVFRISPFGSGFLLPRLQLNRETLLVTFNDIRGTLVMAIDARDGS